jgi:hypothetical protein
MLIASFGRPVLSSAVALAFVITMNGAASSRNNGRAPDRNAAPVPAAPLRAGPLVDMMTGLIRDCERLTAELI